MTDECKHCKLRGDINGCLVTDCSKHKDWYAVEQQNRIERLEAAIRTYRENGITKNQFELFDLLEVGDL